MSGCVSPYLYLEAYDLISHDPYLLTKLGRFEVRILRWAIRHQVLTKELAAQIFEVVEMNQGFHPVHFELMPGSLRDRGKTGIWWTDLQLPDKNPAV